PPLPHPLRHRGPSPPVGRAPGGDARPAARPVRLCPVGPAPAPAAPRPRPPRHLPLVLDAAGRLALVRLGDQGPVRRGAGRGPRRPARPRPALHLLRPARADDLLPGRAAAATGALPVRPTRRAGRGGAGPRAHLLGG